MRRSAARSRVESWRAQIATARERMTEINQQREGLQLKVRERERAIEGGRQVILRLLGEASTLKNQLAQIEEYLAGIDRETARATREETVAAAEIERLDIARKQLSETVAQRQMELETVTGERRRTEQDLADRRNLAGELRREIDARQTEVSQIRARKESLEQVLAHRTYTTESVKRLFASLEKGKADDLKLLGVLADYVEVDPQFEKPAEEFLHEELEYVVVENWQQAERGLDFIRAELEGRATFLVHPEPNGHARGRLPEPAIGPETGISARLSDSLRLTNGFKDRAIDLMPRVSMCFLAEDRAAAQRLAVSYPHLYFLLTDGACYHGHTVTGGKKSGAGPLAMKREARELAVKLKGRQSALDEMLARLDGLTQEIIGFEAELERLRALQQSREKDRVALDHEMRKLGEDLARTNSRVSVARLELDRLRRDAEKIGRPARAQRERRGGEGTSARGERTGAGDAARGTGEAGRPGGHHRRGARRDPRGAGRPGRALPRRALRHGPPGAAVPRDHQPAQRHRARNLPPGRTARAPAGRQHRTRPEGRAIGRADHCRSKPRSTRWPPRMPACAKPCAPMKKSSRDCARRCRKRRRSARRSRSTWCASRPS